MLIREISIFKIFFFLSFLGVQQCTVSRAREKCTQESLVLYDPGMYANVVATSYIDTRIVTH